METKVQITINDISERKSASIRAALGPDNVDFPEGLSLEMENLDNMLVFYFHSTRNMRNLIGTIDEVMSHIQVALKVME